MRSGAAGCLMPKQGQEGTGSNIGFTNEDRQKLPGLPINLPSPNFDRAQHFSVFGG